MLSPINSSRREMAGRAAIENMRPADSIPAIEAAPWVRTLQHWAGRIPYEATRPETLVGMGLGAGIFQAGRVLGLRTLLGAGLRGPAALWLGKGAGLAAETTGFIAASRGVTHLMGKPVDTDIPSLGREWLSLGMFLGAMRFAHGGVRAAFGASWAPKSGWQKFQYALAQQGATFGAVTGTALAEQSLEWRKYADANQLIGESVTMMGVFQMAGALVERSLGHRLGPVLQGLEARARRLEQKAGTPRMDSPLSHSLAAAIPEGGSFPMGEGLFFTKEHSPKGERAAREHMAEEVTANIITLNAIGPGEVVRLINDPKIKFDQEILTKNFHIRIGGSFNLTYLEHIEATLKKKAKQPDGTLRPIRPDRKVILFFDEVLNPSLPPSLEIPFGEKGFSVPKVEHRVIQTGSQNGEKGVDELLKEPEPLPGSAKAPDSPRYPRETSLLNIGEAHLPIPVENFGELSRKVRVHPEQIEDRLLKHDLSIVLKSSIGFKVQFALAALNGLPRLPEITGGRTVTFSWPGHTAGAAVFKQGDKFVDGANRQPEQPVRATPPSTRRDPGKVAVLDRPTVPGPDRPNDKESKAELWRARHLPPLLDDLIQLPQFLRQTAQGNYPGTHPYLILEGHRADPQKLGRITAEIGPGLDPGTSWELLVPANTKGGRSLLAVLKEGKVQWTDGPTNRWEKAKEQMPFSKRIVTDPAEIYQHLEALSHAKDVPADRMITFRHRGNLSEDYLEQLGPFLERTLNYYALKGKKFLITDQDGKPLLDLVADSKGWRFTLQPITVFPPPKK